MGTHVQVEAPPAFSPKPLILCVLFLLLLLSLQLCPCLMLDPFFFQSPSASFIYSDCTPTFLPISSTTFSKGSYSICPSALLPEPRTLVSEANHPRVFQVPASRRACCRALLPWFPFFLS